MTDSIQLTQQQAQGLFERIEDDDQQSFLKYLMDHPGQQMDPEVIQQDLGFAEHRQVALAAYGIGEIASALGLERPWIEGQRGYTMDVETANTLLQAAHSHNS